MGHLAAAQLLQQLGSRAGRQLAPEGRQGRVPLLQLQPLLHPRLRHRYQAPLKALDLRASRVQHISMTPVSPSSFREQVCAVHTNVPTLKRLMHFRFLQEGLLASVSGWRARQLCHHA